MYLTPGTRIPTAPCAVAALLSLGALSLTLAACVVGEELDGEDPAGELADLDEEWWDEGPLPEDVASDADEAVADDILYAYSPRFQLPFPCGQIWAGQTRTAHSPRDSVDFNRADDYGDKVVAAAAGTVTRVGNTGGTSYGRWIEISHGNGFTTRYAHLSSQSVFFGQSVRQGQEIGRVGSTGGSTGPHLHYEQRHNGSAVRARFDDSQAYYFGTRNYRSQNSCGGSPGHPGRVNTSGISLNVRRGPGTGYQIVGSLADGSHVTIRCQKHGQSISGTYGTTTLWDNIGTGFVSDAYIYTGSDGRVAPNCP